ncbi:MAG: hypothetical protein KDB00_14340 [Planctomycetales bacterium]|nr:hypothetical protein [Planctomycetales bacterium]
MTIDNHFTGELTSVLSEMFCEEVSIDVLDQQRHGSASVIVVQMHYTRRGSSNHTTRVSQTAVVLDDAELDLPQFALWPHAKGVTGMLLGRLINMGDINFDDSPKFSNEYHLHGWNEQSVRMLFTKQLRSHFADNPNWSARGVRKYLVVFKQNEVVSPNQLNDFVDNALKTITLFQQSEEQLDEQPNIRRTATIDDLVATAGRMGPIHAMMIKKELEKSRVSPSEIGAFLAQPTPRSKPPKGLRYQVGGDNPLLIVLGAVFFIAGIIIPILIFLLAPANDRMIAIPFALAFPLIGVTILSFSIQYGRRKKRLLRSGTLATGKITKVERTSVQVNNAQRYHLHVDYTVQGQNQSTIANIYSNIEKARELESTGEPVRVLIDPADHKKILCIDTLLIFD